MEYTYTGFWEKMLKMVGWVYKLTFTTTGIHGGWIYLHVSLPFLSRLQLAEARCWRHFSSVIRSGVNFALSGLALFSVLQIRKLRNNFPKYSFENGVK